MNTYTPEQRAELESLTRAQLASLKKSAKQAERGETVYLGSFAKYAK